MASAHASSDSDAAWSRIVDHAGAVAQAGPSQRWSVKAEQLERSGKGKDDRPPAFPVVGGDRRAMRKPLLRDRKIGAVVVAAAEETIAEKGDEAEEDGERNPRGQLLQP